MSLVSRSIFIDTQYLIGISFNFDKSEIKSLIALASAGHTKVYITDITDKEIEKNIISASTKAIEKINQSEARILKGIPEWIEFLKKYDEKKVISFLLDRYNTFKKECNITILPSKDISILDVYAKYANNEPPFGAGAKKHEFPDAFALLAILKWSFKTDTKAYLLSGDIDWIEFAKHSNITDPTSWEIIKNPERLFHLKDLPEFLDMVYKTEIALKDLASFWDKIIENRISEIQDAIRTFSWDPEWIDDFDQDTKILNVYRVKATIIEKEIIEVDREIAMYNMKVDIELVVVFKITEYRYDKDGDKFQGIKVHSVPCKSSITSMFECSFACTEGLETNFTLTNIEGPDIVKIYYNEEEILDIRAWTQSFPVIIYGTMNGKITESGEGMEEYKNFEEAKIKFPTLELTKDTDDFYVSKENIIPEWVEGPLIYFTPAAINHLYG